MPTQMGKGRGRQVTRQNIPCSELTVLTSVSTMKTSMKSKATLSRHQNLLPAISNPSHTIWSWLCCFSIFVKRSFSYSVLRITSEREASCLPPAQCPSQTDLCTASQWPGHSGAAGPQRPSAGPTALGRWGHGPWQILRQTSAHHSLGNSVCSR